MLGIALAAGTAGVIAARWLWRDQRPHPGAGPLIAALFGVALVGAGAGLIVSAEGAVLAVVLEVLRARYMPAIRAQAGLLAYAAIAIATRGAAPRRLRRRSCCHGRRRAAGRDGGARDRLLVGLGVDGALQAHAPAPSAGG